MFQKPTVYPVVEAGPQGPITDQERRRLGEIEATIENAVTSWYDAGMAIDEARRGRLYREKHATLTDWVRSRFGFGKSYAYSLQASWLAANDFTKRLPKDVHHGGQISPKLTLPEHAARKFRKVPASFRDQVVAKVVQFTDQSGEEITTAVVERAIDAVVPTPKPKSYEIVICSRCKGTGKVEKPVR